MEGGSGWKMSSSNLWDTQLDTPVSKCGGGRFYQCESVGEKNSVKQGMEECYDWERCLKSSNGN